MKRFLGHGFYGICWALIARNWFWVTDWQWWLLIVGLACVNVYILEHCMQNNHLGNMPKEMRDIFEN